MMVRRHPASESAAHADRDRRAADNRVLHLILDATVERLRFVEEIRDVTGQSDCGPKLIRETEIDGRALETKEVSRRARRRVAGDVVAGVVDEHAQAESTMRPGEARVPGARDKSGDLTAAEIAPSSEITVRAERRIVDQTTQSL